MQNLSEALGIKPGDCVAFVGAGGKTSALYQAAKDEIIALLGTSTHMGDWQTAQADHHFVWANGSPLPEMEAVLGAGITLVTGNLDTNTRRYGALSDHQLELLKQLSGYHDIPFLIEADGSRKLSLKAPGEHEPAIPQFCNLVVVVAGLSGLGKLADSETIFRNEIFTRLSGLETDGIITPAALANLLVHPEGGLKNMPASARRIALLNQADTPPLQSNGKEISEMLLPSFDKVIVSSLQPYPAVIWAVYEKPDRKLITEIQEIAR